MNSINWPASSVWVFIAQLGEHCSANAEATGSNPVEAPKIFFSGYFRNCLNCDSLRWSHNHFTIYALFLNILKFDNLIVTQLWCLKWLAVTEGWMKFCWTMANINLLSCKQFNSAVCQVRWFTLLPIDCEALNVWWFNRFPVLSISSDRATVIK